MTLAVDRAVGNILSRIDDPNEDGNMSDSIADNTIVVFLNDNGGPTYLNPNGYDNSPATGFKGSGWEGGLRTPYLIRAPGVAPGTFNPQVSSMDLFPTFVAAAGGQMTGPTDGVNLLPYLEGTQAGDVHDALFFRNFVNYSGVREGDWKLTKPFANEVWQLFHLNPDGSGETVDLSQQYPEIVAKMVRDFVAWEVTVDKPRNSNFPKVNDFDVFVRRNDLTRDANWGYSQSWRNGDNLDQIASLHKDDPSPNTVLVFTPRNDADYWSANTRNRMSGVSWNLLDQGVQDLPGTGEFMLNEMRFQGQFTGAVNRRATIEGKPVLFVNSLSGKSPGLRLDATVTGTNKTFFFTLNLDSILYNDFVIEGDGNATFEIGGVIRNFWNPAGVTKRGTSTVTLKGHNTYTGATIVEQGRIIVNGANAALDGTAAIQVQSGGRLTLQAGLIRTGVLDVRQGTFDFLGGTLQTDQVIGSLVNPAGSLMMGSDLLPGVISGDFTQTDGTLDLHWNPQSAASIPSLLTIGGQAQLGGRLVVSFDEPDAFPYDLNLPLITATGGMSGSFSEVVVPDFPPDAQWSLNYSSNAVTLVVNQNVTIPDAADFNADGNVDGADFLIWQQNLESSGFQGDANRDGYINGADLTVWQSQFAGPPQQNSVAVQAPEPSALGLSCVAVLVSLDCARRGWPAWCARPRVVL